MLKLLIVDDEVFVRKGIQNTINWKEEGYEVVGEAGDGEKALEIARATRPDVVLTDIQMPKMNGLELIKALKSEFPNIKVIVLSCHNEFEYVREAMQMYGAMDYLLKLSMQPEDLIKLMQKVKDVIDSEKSENVRDMKSTWHINANRYHLLEKTFNELLETGTALGLDNESLFRFKSNRDSFAIVCINLDSSYSNLTRNNIYENFNLLKFSILNIVEEILCNYNFSGDVFYSKEVEFGVCISYDQTDQGTDERLLSFCSEVVFVLENVLDLTASCGIGSIVSSLADLPGAYNEAKKASALRIYDGKGSVHTVKDIFEGKNTGCYDYMKEQILRENIENGDFSESKKIIMLIADQILDEHNLLPSKVKHEFNEILNTFSNIVRQYEGNLSEISCEWGEEPYTALDNCISIREMKEWFGIFVDSFALYMGKIKSKRFSQEIRRAIDYINTNYFRDIKLGEIGKCVHLSEAYLSVLFKKETGEYFTDYVNCVRIEKAKSLLKTKDVNVTDIGEMVGYASLSYFSRMFKNIVGMSPAQYRRFVR